MGEATDRQEKQQKNSATRPEEIPGEGNQNETAGDISVPDYVMRDFNPPEEVSGSPKDANEGPGAEEEVGSLGIPATRSNGTWRG